MKITIEFDGLGGAPVVNAAAQQPQAAPSGTPSAMPMTEAPRDVLAAAAATGAHNAGPAPTGGPMGPSSSGPAAFVPVAAGTTGQAAGDLTAGAAPGFD